MQKKCHLCEIVRQFILALLAGGFIAALTIRAELSEEITFWSAAGAAVLTLMYFGFQSRKK